MNRNCFALLAALALCLGLCAPASAQYFTDVPDSLWCADTVAWAVERGITNGTSSTEFSPDTACTVGQILTFLWREQGMPEPVRDNPFEDVGSGDYFCKAALWAYEKGVVTDTIFAADTPCTRRMTVTYLWRLAGCPFAEAAGTFSDVLVTDPYAQIVAWAVEKGITAGTSATEFSPEQICSRAQIVTFLYRFDKLPEASKPVETPAPSVSAPVVMPEPEVPEVQALSIGISTSKSASVVGTMYNVQFSLSASATGGYTYRFEVMQNGEVTKSTDWSSDNGLSGSLSGNGTCVVNISVKDSSGETTSTTINLLESRGF